MSSARRPGASWLGQSYDKLALAVVLALLLVSAAILIALTGKARRDQGAQPGLQPGWTGRPVEPLDLSALKTVMDLINNPVQIPLDQQGMMIGEVRVASIPGGAPIPQDATVDPFTGDAQPASDYDPDSDGDGLTDKQEMLAGLNPVDPSDAAADLDSDGYTNTEELQMGTDLKDPASYPPPLAKLRLVRTVVNPFRFRFLGVSKLADGDRYQLNLRSLERTYFARLGDTVEGYKVGLYEEKTPEGPTLTLQQGESSIRLVQGRVINQEARSADLVLLLDGSRYRRQIGDDLKLKDLLYKIVDIKADRVVLRDERDGKESTVPVLSLEERSRLQNENAPPAPPAATENPAADAAAVTEALFK